MRSFIKKKEEILADEIDRVRRQMLHVELYSEEYSKLLGHFERLSQMQNESGSRRVSPDTMVLVAGNLLGIVVIVGYERMHVITSRAIQFILRQKSFGANGS